MLRPEYFDDNEEPPVQLTKLTKLEDNEYNDILNALQAHNCLVRDNWQPSYDDKTR